MAPHQPCASPSPSPSPKYNSKNLRRGQQLKQEGAGASSAGIGKRVGSNHVAPHRSASFHGRSTDAAATSAEVHQKQQMRRPKTQPDLIAAAGGRSKNSMISASSPTAGNMLRIGKWSSGEQRRKVGVPVPVPVPVPAKVLMNVNVQRSLGALQVMASTEWTVDQLVAASVNQYVKEGRRPLLLTTDPSAFDLHYSQFCLECLEPKEKLIGLGSRNFFLCPRSTKTATSSPSPSSAAILSSPSPSTSTPSSSSSSCFKEADKASKIAIPWFRFMDFLF